MLNQIDNVHTIIVNIKNDLEIIEEIIEANNNRKQCTVINLKYYDYFCNNLLFNYDSILKNNNIKLDIKDSYLNLKINLILTKITNLLEKSNKIITDTDLSNIKQCIDEINNFDSYFNSHYKDNKKAQFFYQLKNMNNYLDSINYDNLFKDEPSTIKFLKQCIEKSKSYSNLISNIPNLNEMQLSVKDYSQFEKQLIRNFNDLDHLIKNFLYELIKENDQSSYSSTGILPGEYKLHFYELIENHEYDKLLSVKMLKKNINNPIIIKSFLNRFREIIIDQYRIINNYGKEKVVLNYDDIFDEPKDYDLDLFDDEKNLKYYTRNQKLLYKYKNTSISKHDLKMLQLLSQKMVFVIDKLKSIVSNLKINKIIHNSIKIYKKNDYIDVNNNKKNKTF